MLPTKPKSQLIVSKAEPAMLSARQGFSKVLNKRSVRQFAAKVGNFASKYPFWILVIGSLGIHTGFMLLTPNPLKKTEEPREVIVPTLNLPPKKLATIPKQNKSLFDNLFVKPTNPANKLDIPINTSSRSPNLDIFDRVDNFPLPNNNSSFFDNLETMPPVEESKPRTSPPKAQPTQAPRSVDAGKLDNTIANKSPSSNLKPELQGNGIKDGADSSTAKKDETGKPAKKTVIGTNLATTGQDEMVSTDLTTSMFTDPDILSKGQIDRTRIAAKDVLINADTREKGIEWIPPKVTSVAGKSGTVTYAWLVAPDGKVTKKFLEFKKTVDPELVNIVRETVKDYKFQPISNPQSGRYRLVLAKYIFP